MSDCLKCGKTLTENLKFCPECGTKLTEVAPPVPLPPPPEPEPIQEGVPQQGEPAPPPPPQSKTEEQDQQPPPIKSESTKKSLKPIHIIIAVIIVGVLIFAALYYGFQGSEDNPFAGISDTDGDGYNDDIDAFINDPDEWKDTDSDGVGDNGDAFPNDYSEIKDSDGDGHGDNSDQYPNDPDEWQDTDGDGVGDNEDVFPNDSNEQHDSDNDGVGDNSDAFPNDSTQWADRDGDGYGDNPNGNNPDAFPDDSAEWKDTDSDGVGDNADIYDNGNGGIYLKVLYYNGDSHPDEGGGGDELDPYFTIWIDLDDDNVVDDNEKSVSQVYDNYDELYNPHSWTVDVPDDIEHVNVGVYVYDNDFWSSNDIIDTSPSEDGTWRIHSYYPAIASSNIQYDCDGSDDGIDDEEDAYIECEYGVKKMT